MFRTTDGVIKLQKIVLYHKTNFYYPLWALKKSSDNEDILCFPVFVMLSLFGCVLWYNNETINRFLFSGICSTMMLRYPFLLLYATLLLQLTLINSDNSMKPVNPNTCRIRSQLREEIRSYEPIVHRIIKEALHGEWSNFTYDELAKFVDKFGARMSGTTNLEMAIDYMIDLSRKEGFENVHGEDVFVPYWIR